MPHKELARDSTKTINRFQRKLKRELHEARMRAKYGPTGKPAPVIVKQLPQGERSA